MNTQSIRCTVFGASCNEFEMNGNKVSNIFLHTFSPAEATEAESYKGNAYSRLSCEKEVFERIKLPATPVELDLVCRLLPGPKNSMKLHVVDVRNPSASSKAS